MASHCVGIYLARHDRRTRLILWNRQLAQAAARAGGQPANVVRNLHQRCGQSFHRALCEDDFIVRRERGELVAVRAEGKSGEFGDLLGCALGKFRMRVQPGAYGGSADRQIVESFERLLQALDVALQQAGPAAEFLPDGQGHGVLQMRAANLDDVVKFLRLGGDRIVNGLDRRNQRILHPVGGRDVHRGGKRIVRRLRHVHVIVGMDRLLRSHLAAGNLNRAVRDDLVHVHVGLRAAAGLPDAERELIVQLAGDHFVGGLCDQLRFVGGQLAQILIHQRACFLERAEGADQLRRHGVASNVEVQQGALRLRAPVDIRGDFDLPHAVGFNASWRGFGRRWFGESRHDGSCCVQRDECNRRL